MSCITVTRFNNETWDENNKYRKDNNIDGCLYTCPTKINPNIVINKVLYVLEMNNSTNKIMGIGRIKNRIRGLHKNNIYSDRNYNRYTYNGNLRIDKEKFNNYEKDIIKFFEIICFTGKSHLKRGQGIQLVPVEIIKKCKKILDLNIFFDEMFKKHFNLE